MRIIVASLEDPVARPVAERLGPGEATDLRVGRDPLRRLSKELYLLRRSALHIHDDSLAPEFPAELSTQVEALIFPSVHRSALDRPALTVHPLGNLTAATEVGGRPRELNPVPARLMTEAFLRLHEEGQRLGIETTFEATHHGPWLPWPSFFIEIGSTPAQWEREDLQRALVHVLSNLEVSRTAHDQVAVGVGGGHYLPRFRDLVRQRRLSVGHLIPSHHFPGLDREMVEQVVARTLRSEVVVYARAQDAAEGKFRDLLPEVREKDLGRRESP